MKNHFLRSCVAGLLFAVTAVLLVGCVIHDPQRAPQTIWVTGEVRKPGAFPWTNGLTALNAVQLAGGLKRPPWTQKQLTIYRHDGTKETHSIGYNFQYTNTVPIFPGDRVNAPKVIW